MSRLHTNINRDIETPVPSVLVQYTVLLTYVHHANTDQYL